MKYEKRPWGNYQVLRKGKGFKVKRIEVDPGKRLSLQSHDYRAEVWTIVWGKAKVQTEKEFHELKAGESICIPVFCTHRIENTGGTRLVFIEVQTGSYLGEDDIQRYSDDFGRV